MQRRTRLILFWSAVALFVIVSPLLIGYARGYRFSFSHAQILQVGALSLESVPKGAQIIVDGQRTGKKSNTVLASVIPLETYFVRLELEGRRAWSKELVVEPSRITTAHSIVLPPNNIERNVVSPPQQLISDMWVSPDNTWAAAKREGEIGREIVLVNLSSGEVSPILFNDQLISLDFGSVSWSETEPRILFARGTSGEETYWYSYNLETSQLLNISSLWRRISTTVESTGLPTDFTPAYVEPLRGGALAIMSENIFLIDFTSETMRPLNIKGAGAVTVVDDIMVALLSDSTIVRFDATGRIIRTYPQAPFRPANIILSPDREKLLLQGNDQIAVLWLEENNGQPSRQVGDWELIVSTTSPLDEVAWHVSSEHVVFVELGQLALIELDGRGGRNEWRWDVSRDTKVTYNTQTGTVWFAAEDGTLSKSQEIL